MKLVIALIFALIATDSFGQDWHAKWDSAGTTWREKWDRTLDMLNEFPENDRMEILGSAARIGKEMFRVEQREVYARAVGIMMKTPGHAEYYGRMLAEAREKTNDPWHDYRFNVVHEKVSEILSNMPSPEAVRVLGGMLEDTADYPNAEQIIGILKSNGNVNAPAGLAMSALRRINLRGLPDSDSWRDVELWRQWWQELKSGNKAFSFKGQSVEYRFKPDGTWDTLPIANPPDDAVKPPMPSPKPATEKIPDQAMQPAKSDDTHHGLVWLWIPVLLFMAGAWRIFRRRGAA